MAGGTLVQILGNLSCVLRERYENEFEITACPCHRKLRRDHRGRSFLVVGALYVSSPKYIFTAVDKRSMENDSLLRFFWYWDKVLAI